MSSINHITYLDFMIYVNHKTNKMIIFLLNLRCIYKKVNQIVNSRFWARVLKSWLERMMA